MCLLDAYISALLGHGLIKLVLLVLVDGAVGVGGRVGVGGQARPQSLESCGYQGGPVPPVSSAVQPSLERERLSGEYSPLKTLHIPCFFVGLFLPSLVNV